MKIFFFIKDVSLTGGTERVTVNLASLFASKGHDVTIISYYHGKKEPTYRPSSDVKLKFLLDQSCFDSGHAFSRIKRFVQAFFSVRKFVKTECKSKDSVIISQNFFSNALIWLSGAASRSIGCEHFKYDVYPAPIRFVRNCVYRYFGHIVCLTDKDSKRFSGHLQENRVLTIPNMVASNDSIEVDVSSKTMIAVGRLAPQKGFDMLIYAMKAIAQKNGDWILNIFGEGEQKEYLENLIKDFGLQAHVFLKGYSKNIVNEFARSGFFVLSSRYEGFPLVLVEALGLGMPCVAFDCPEGPSLLLEDGGGCLVPFDRNCDSPNQAGFKQNVERLQESLLFMINNRDFRKQCIAHRDVIKEKLSPEVIYKKWESLLKY